MQARSKPRGKEAKQTVKDRFVLGMLGSLGLFLTSALDRVLYQTPRRRYYSSRGNVRLSGPLGVGRGYQAYQVSQSFMRGGLRI